MSDLKNSAMNHQKLIFFSFALLFTCCTASCTGQPEIKVNMAKITGHISPMIFGGNNYGFSDQSISDQHKRSGFNVARYDAFMNDIVPSTTLENYRNNVDGVRDVRKWDWSRIDRDLTMLTASGFKILFIINYCPLWLTNTAQNAKNTINSIPADWAVYEDIVTKVCQHVQSRIFAIEIWNEPDLGLSIDGSSYKNRLPAYLDLYYHTARAIRRVNSKIKIGGAAIGNTYDRSYLYALLNSNRTKKNLNFYSYHFYGIQEQGNIRAIKQIAASAGKKNFSVYISEWNYSAEFNGNPMNTNSPDAIPFTANALIDQMKEGADLSILYCMDDYKKAESFYTMDQKGAMVPKVETYKLLSVELGLGKGTSTAFETISDDGVNALSAENCFGENIVCMVNNTKGDQTASVTICNSRFTGTKTVEIYIVDAATPADRPVAQRKVNFRKGKAVIKFIKLPSKSVGGLKFKN